MGPGRAAIIIILSSLGLCLLVITAGTDLEKAASAANELSREPEKGCVRSWELIPSPSGSNYSNLLRSVSVISATDVWAVGDQIVDAANLHHNLALHWDGTKWGVVPTPNAGTSHNYLMGVEAISANDVWAVGYYGVGNSAYAMTMHWDGMQWSVIPNPASTNVLLYTVSASTSNDVWTVGKYYIGMNSYTLTMHWDGVQWTVVPSPAPGTGSGLWGIETLTANDVWAVGAFAVGSVGYTLTLHWNGVEWQQVASPNVGTENTLNSVAAVSSNDIWAVGWSSEGTLTVHWDGVQWSVVPSPNVGAEGSILQSVAMISADDGWAVGYFYSQQHSRTLTLHWNGVKWSVVPSPSPATDANILYGVAADLSGEVWTVGTYLPLGPARTLVLHYPPPCGTSTPTPATIYTSTSTPATTRTASPTSTLTCTPTLTPISTMTPSLTSTPPTATATNTSSSPTASPQPTPCPITFTDVPVGSTFYEFIRCLACRGIINGYPDGTFKPNNNVTRGQLSKIVSNSAGFNDPQTAQMFEDVPVGSTFFDFVGRLASRGYISGYPCGGPGEPCTPPGNLPYFRPNANATRGQISKIVANAAGFQDPVSGQTFEDVPVGSTFYDFIERLASRGVMSGYPCGSVPTEPCVPPGNRPYFRPNNNATRGQTSKIVSNTFFPACATPARR